MITLRSILSGAIALTAIAFSAAAIAGSAEDVKITDIVAFGNNCKTADDGKPEDYAYTIAQDGKSFSVDFSNFILDEKGRSGDCSMIVSVDFPAGKTGYAYASQVRGEAKIESGDTATIETRVRLGSGKWKTNTTSLAEGTDGDVETKATSNNDSATAPCGGKNAVFVVALSAKLTGTNKSFLELTSADGKLGNVIIKTEDCD